MCGSSVKIKKKRIDTPVIRPLIVISPKHVLMPYYIHGLCGRRAPPERTRGQWRGLAANRRLMPTTCGECGRALVGQSEYRAGSSSCPAADANPGCRARKGGKRSYEVGFRAPEKNRTGLPHLVYATRSHEVLDTQDEHRW